MFHDTLVSFAERRVISMIKQFLGHLHTINHHKWLVTRDCIRVGLISQGLKHDLSKYAPIEFLAGVKYYDGGCAPYDAASHVNILFLLFTRSIITSGWSQETALG